MPYLGIDIGGTGIKAGLVDEAGQIRRHLEIATRAEEGASAILGRMEEMVRTLLSRDGASVVACGVGSAGRIDHQNGHVVFASGNLPGWTGVPLRQELMQRLGLPVTVDNDVNAAALAEGWIGSARGSADFLMLTLGTGVGGAVVIGGKLWRGARFGAGEVGHMALYPGGRPCNCGGTGCAEQYVSAKALTRRANEALGGGHRLRGIREVIASAERSAPPERREAARKAVEFFCGDLALLLMNLQQAFDPQVVVIGGGIVRLGYWWDRLLEAVTRETRPRSLTIRLKKAHCGPLAGVVGAARLAMVTHGQGAKAVDRHRRGAETPVLPAPGPTDSSPHVPSPTA